jgi:myo-inositol 2-dehydrogenase/D-chiro-inositol 1-dehydrogenase
MRFALVGAGRMGQRHAANLAAMDDASLAWVCDPDLAAARKVAEVHGATATAALDDITAADACDAVIIAAPTELHADLIEKFARAGKPILCEKPLDLDLERAGRCCREVADLGVPIQIAFNRRYDPGHAALAQSIREGEIGKLEICVITSRDAAPPPAGYIERSGGIFHDMTIHDFDMIRFLSGEEPVAVTAMGSALFVDEARRHGDVDTVAISLKLASGALCLINASRHAVYGHDQRIEAVGDKGMLISPNVPANGVERYSAQATGARGPYLASSRDRYREAYRRELADFVYRIRQGKPPAVTLDDGYRALLVADAAARSFREGRTIAIGP